MPSERFDPKDPNIKAFTFNPKVTDDLRPEILPLVGKTFVFRRCSPPNESEWIIHPACEEEFGIPDEQRGWIYNSIDLDEPQTRSILTVDSISDRKGYRVQRSEIVMFPAKPAPKP